MKNARRRLLLPVLSFLALTGTAGAASDARKDGWYYHLMLDTDHIHPYRHFDEFNPGAGAECWFSREWAAAGGYFRNSLDRPSFYAGVVYAPELLHWRWFRLTAMGGVISGYNFGRFGVNFILIPPIRQDNLPFTVGFQVKYRVR